GTGVLGERAHREHRRAPSVHGNGKTAGGSGLRRHVTRRQHGHDRCRLRRGQAQGNRRERRPRPLRTVVGGTYFEISITTYCPFSRRAVNLILSPGCSPTSRAGSARNTRIMAGRSSSTMAPCLIVTLPALGSTRRTS